MPKYRITMRYSCEKELGEVEAEDAMEALHMAETKADDLWPSECTSIDSVTATNCSNGVCSEMEM